jgi:signal transduction histidine kinase
MRAALARVARGEAGEEIALERGLLTGIAAFRTAAWAWAAVAFALNLANAPGPERPVAGAVLLGLCLAWTLTASALVRRAPRALLDNWAMGLELVLAGALAYLDWWVYGGVAHSQSLGTVWPLAVVLTVGVAHGGRGGFAAGLLLGAVRATGELVFLAGSLTHGDGQLSAAGTTVLYALGGAVAGFVTAKLREAEREIAVARAREEVARTLHDGVLQTLAIVQRRSEDAALVALAREQEQDLREFLFTARPGGAPSADELLPALRAAAAEAERRHGLRVQVVAIEEPEGVDPATVAALRGAVGEALTNAAKHGHAGGATVYVEPGDGGALFCSVKDDGRGFDAASITEGVGLSRSIRGRIAEVGGTVAVDGRPGRGAEVRLTVPARPT